MRDASPVCLQLQPQLHSTLELVLPCSAAHRIGASLKRTARSAEVMASPDKYQGKTVPGALGRRHLHTAPCCLHRAGTGRRMGPPIYVELAGRLNVLRAVGYTCLSQQMLYLLLIEKPFA